MDESLNVITTYTVVASLCSRSRCMVMGLVYRRMKTSTNEQNSTTMTTRSPQTQAPIWVVWLTSVPSSVMIIQSTIDILSKTCASAEHISVYVRFTHCKQRLQWLCSEVRQLTLINVIIQNAVGIMYLFAKGQYCSACSRRMRTQLKIAVFNVQAVTTAYTAPLAPAVGHFVRSTHLELKVLHTTYSVPTLGMDLS
jgi:hypothetical protein